MLAILILETSTLLKMITILCQWQKSWWKCVTIIHTITSSENIVNKCGIIYLWNNAHICVPLEMRPTEFVWLLIDDWYRMSWFTGEQSAIEDLTDDVEMKIYFHQFLMTQIMNKMLFNPNEIANAFNDFFANDCHSDFLHNFELQHKTQFGFRAMKLL